MKHLTLEGSFFEMGHQFGRESKKEIKTFAKMAYLMASLSKKPGSQPKEKCFWIYEGCPCKNQVSKYDFKD